MSDMLENLEQLTPEEMQKVANLIQKFAKRKEISEEKPKKSKEVDKDELVIENEVGRKESRKKIILPDESPPEAKGRAGRGRTQPRNPIKNADGVRRQKGNKGIQARTEHVRLSGSNEFERMRERNQEQKDTEADRILWAGREPTPRPNKFEYIEAQCKACGLWFDVDRDSIYVEDGVVIFTCNNCAGRR